MGMQSLKELLPAVIIVQPASYRQYFNVLPIHKSFGFHTHLDLKMPSPFGDPPKAASLLDFHRVMAPTAGVRISPLCLGAMNFGDAWEDMMGKCDKKTVFEILDFFHQQGGNFIDT
jgi:hypothetical protein